MPSYRPNPGNLEAATESVGEEEVATASTASR